MTLLLANTGKRLMVNPHQQNNNNKCCDDNSDNKISETTKSSSSSSSSNEIREWNERLEIVSLVGTFDMDGGFHLHMSVSDSKGHVFGGHLMNGQIFTTLELVIGVVPGIQFKRPLDDGPNGTGFNELVVNTSSKITTDEE
jgi:Plants and Prokaryotes Conserved (PCC) domain